MQPSSLHAVLLRLASSFLHLISQLLYYFFILFRLFQSLFQLILTSADCPSIIVQLAMVFVTSSFILSVNPGGLCRLATLQRENIVNNLVAEPDVIVFSFSL